MQGFHALMRLAQFIVRAGLYITLGRPVDHGPRENDSRSWNWYFVTRSVKSCEGILLGPTIL